MTVGARGRPEGADLQVLLRSALLYAVTQYYKLTKGAKFSRKAALNHFFTHNVIKSDGFDIWKTEHTDEELKNKMLKDLENALQNRREELEILIGGILAEGRIPLDVDSVETWRKVAFACVELLDRQDSSTTL